MRGSLIPNISATAPASSTRIRCSPAWLAQAPGAGIEGQHLVEGVLAQREKSASGLRQAVRSDDGIDEARQWNLGLAQRFAVAGDISLEERVRMAGRDRRAGRAGGWAGTVPTVEHANQGGPQGLIARFAFDGGSQVAESPVQVHRLSAVSALTLVVVGEGKNHVGLRWLLGTQFLQNLLGLPPLTGRFDGPRQPDSVIALFGFTAGASNELFEQSPSFVGLALPTDDRREAIQGFQICGRKLHDPPKRRFGAPKVLKMYVVERRRAA